MQPIRYDRRAVRLGSTRIVQVGFSRLAAYVCHGDGAILDGAILDGAILDGATDSAKDSATDDQGRGSDISEIWR